MKVVGLISGGKDSCYNLMQCIAAGHKIKALANLAPKDKDELDSFMYQSVGHMGISLYADAMGLPLFRREIEGSSLSTKSIDYSITEGDEVEDLYNLLKHVKEECDVDAVSVGAVLSDYQRVRVENVCQRLGLVSLAYMWRRDQSELLQEMIECGVEAILIKVAAVGLTPSKHLGKTIKQIKPYLEELKDKYNVHVCGEGGEYETFTLDCPLFKKKIVVEETEMITSSGDVGYLNFKSLRLVDKNTMNDSIFHQHHLLSKVKLKSPVDYLHDLRLNEEEQQAEDEAKENFKNVKDLGDKDSGGDYKIEESSSSSSSSSLVLEDQTPFVGDSNGFTWVAVYGLSVHDVFRKLEKQLSEKGLSISRIVSVKMFVKNMDDYPVYNKEYIHYFSSNPPSRTCVQAPLSGDVCVCMDVLVWSKDFDASSPSRSSSRKTLHVQSISHWAPANIGPYSQAVKVGDFIMIAGMIGLVPGSLEVVEGGVELEARLALRHVGRVLAAISPKADIRAVVQGVCYVTNLTDIAVAKRMMARVSESQITTYVVVPSLPKRALIEWQTWAHLDNNKFDYEERGYTRDNVNVTLRRRISYDKSVCAIITTASCQNVNHLTQPILEEIINYSLQKMNICSDTDLPVNLTVYYKAADVSAEFLLNVLKVCSSNVSKFVVPVLGVEDKSTLLSLALIRH